MGIRTVIIEDEKQAVVALKEDLKNYCPELDVIGDAATLSDAELLIKENEPQLVFLDIQLKDGTAFDLLKKLEEEYPFKIIFTTAYSRYALQALKISALDYLLKPIDTAALVKAVEKAKNNSELTQKKFIENYINNTLFKTPNKKIAIPVNTGFEIHQLNEIIRIQSDGNYVTIYLKNKSSLLTSKTLKQMEDMLSEYNFIRIHQSHLINLENLKKYSNKEGGYVTMVDGVSLPVSKRKKTTLLERLYNFN